MGIIAPPTRTWGQVFKACWPPGCITLSDGKEDSDRRREEKEEKRVESNLTPKGDPPPPLHVRELEQFASVPVTLDLRDILSFEHHHPSISPLETFIWGQGHIGREDDGGGVLPASNPTWHLHKENWTTDLLLSTGWMATHTLESLPRSSVQVLHQSWPVKWREHGPFIYLPS